MSNSAISAHFSDLSESSKSSVWQGVSTLEQLLDKSNNELRQLIQANGSVRESEILRWQRAMFNLRRCHHAFAAGASNEPSADLSWTFWSGSPTEMSPRLNESDGGGGGHKAPTPYKRGPMIAHRFTKKFRALSSTCNYCNKQMFFGLKCIECKYSCHNDCEASVPPSCGVPADVMAEFKQTFSHDGSQVAQPSPEIVEAGNGFFFSRTSSRKASTVLAEPAASVAAAAAANGQRRDSQSISALKNFFEELAPTTDVRKEVPARATADAKQPTSLNHFVGAAASAAEPPHSPETQSLNGSMASSNGMGEFDATDDRQSEWGIQHADIRFGERIGQGRFGTVFRGKWYGDVAVKELNANYLDDTQSLEAFKTQVATFKNTRHDNIVLFLGFCASPQAIVTTLCKGQTLYTHIHLLREKFNLFRATSFAQQISNGMGYLHAKGIIHKDLTTKNIFVENVRLIITDFGLFSAAKMQFNKNGFHIPANWLCYLAPELIRGLQQVPDGRLRHGQAELCFSEKSDVYAFGTVWYEILSGQFPFKGQDSHSIMYQIGCGKKQTLANLQATREVKDILMMSWAFQADDRQLFKDLLKLLKDLPNKQMPPNPKRPMHISLSAEAVF